MLPGSDKESEMGIIMQNALSDGSGHSKPFCRLSPTSDLR